MNALAPANPSFSTKLPTLQLAVDSTSIGQFKLCPRSYYYTIILGKIPHDLSIHLAFGLQYHSALEFYDWRRTEGLDHEAALELTVLQVLKNSWDPILKRGMTIFEEPKSRPNLLRTVVWYLDQFKSDTLETLVLPSGRPAVELSFRFELDYLASTGEPFLLCGHMDKLSLLDEAPYILDRKTTKTTLSQSYFSKFSPDNQFSLYAFAGHIMYKQNLRGIIVDAAQIAVTFSRFMRQEIPRPAPVLSEWYKDLGHWLKLMDLYAQEGYWPQNDKSCSLFGGCPFRGICSMTPSNREPFLAKSFATRVWNPLEVRGEV